MMKQLLFLLILFSSVQLCAQREGERQLFFFRNGNVLEGTLAEIDSTGNGIMFLNDKTKFRFAMSDISRITDSKMYELENPDKDRRKLWESGFVATIGPSLYIGQNTIANAVTGGVQWTLGYHFKERYTVSAGIAGEGFGSGFVPLFGEGKYTFRFKDRKKPFLYARAGWAKPLSDGMRFTNTKGGPLAEAGIGVVNYFSDKAGFSMSLGYRYQRVSYVERNWWEDNGEIQITEYFHRLAVRFAFLF